MTNALIKTEPEGQPLSMINGGGQIMASPMQTANLLQPTNMQEAMMLAEGFAKSGMFAAKSPEEALTILITGMELGLKPAAAMRSFHVIDRKPVMSADGMQAVCVTKRDICHYFRLLDSTEEVATYTTHRVGDPDPVTLSYTIDQAKKAGLLGKANWQKFPADMLRARCKATLARIVYQDLLLGIYTEDEIEKIPVQSNPNRDYNLTRSSAPPPAQQQATTAAEDVPSSDVFISWICDYTNALQEPELASTVAQIREIWDDPNGLEDAPAAVLNQILQTVFEKQEKRSVSAYAKLNARIIALEGVENERMKAHLAKTAPSGKLEWMTFTQLKTLNQAFDDIIGGQAAEAAQPSTPPVEAPVTKPEPVAAATMTVVAPVDEEPEDPFADSPADLAAKAQRGLNECKDCVKPGNVLNDFQRDKTKKIYNRALCTACESNAKTSVGQEGT